MGKFVYEKNEVKFAETQCGLCIFQKENCENACEKYLQKPIEILEGKIRCSYLKTTNLLDF